MYPKYVNILGVKVSSTTEHEVLDFVADKIKKREKFFITTPNPEIITLAQTDFELKKALNKADLALPDGFGLKFAKSIQRITGREMMIKLLTLANEKKWKVFILGGSESVNRKAKLKIGYDFLNLTIKGNAGAMMNRNLHYKTNRDKKIDHKVQEEITRFQPHLLFDKFFCPD